MSLAYNQDESYKPPYFHGHKYSIFIKPIFYALKENCFLKRLDLKGIRLSISELALLKNVLESNTTLMYVEWDTCPHKGEEDLQERGSQLCKEIQAALEMNTQLQPKNNIHLGKIDEINISHTP